MSDEEEGTRHYMSPFVTFVGPRRHLSAFVEEFNICRKRKQGSSLLRGTRKSRYVILGNDATASGKRWNARRVSGVHTCK
ncbi:hypothetical protein [Herbaspirillum lusitanum]|uniref:hypothetical protein n=1 Tax=Herbaspirillum lusitanum TaxID=213312 RepID=UPI0012F4989C|nr:hypothetical protein [Herbaspirillum lusitanum]